VIGNLYGGKKRAIPQEKLWDETFYKEKNRRMKEK